MSIVQTPTVVVIEDDQLTLHMLTYLLKKRGFDVVGITNARQLTDEKVIQDCAGLVVDINLPFINGIDIMHQIKSKYPDKKVVLTSAENTLTIYKNEGADMLLPKPFSRKDLEKMVRLLCNCDGKRLKQVS